jgi:basic membrane protein A
MTDILVMISVMICLATTLLFSACGEIQENNLTVKVIYSTGGKGDRTFSDSVYAGLLEYQMVFGFELVEFEPENVEEADAKLDEWIAEPLPDGREELIITTGQLFDDFVCEADCDFGDRMVLHLDSNLPECPTLKAIRYDVFSSSFLAGVAAMEVSKDKKAGVIAAMDIPPVNEFIRGFEAGVEYAGGEVTSTVYLSDTPAGFSMPKEARTEALAMYEGVDVILPVAGGSSLGVINAAIRLAEDRESAGEEIEKFTIGVDSDQSIRGAQVVIGSILKRLDRTVQKVLDEINYGYFEPGNFTYGLETGQMEFFVNPNFDDRLDNVVNNAFQTATARDEKAVVSR